MTNTMTLVNPNPGLTEKPDASTASSCKVEIKRDSSVDLFASLSLLTQTSKTEGIHNSSTSVQDFPLSPKCVEDVSMGQSTLDFSESSTTATFNAKLASSKFKCKRSRSMDSFNTRLQLGSNSSCPISNPGLLGNLKLEEKVLLAQKPKTGISVSGKTPTNQKSNLKVHLWPTCWVSVKKQNIKEYLNAEISPRKVRFGNVEIKNEFESGKTYGSSESSIRPKKKKAALVGILKNMKKIKILCTKKSDVKKLNKKKNPSRSTNDATANQIFTEKIIKNKVKSFATKLANRPMKIDTKTSNSSLCQLKSLQSIINCKTFLMLPLDCRNELIQLLPQTDRISLLRQLNMEKNSLAKSKDSIKNQSVVGDSMLSAFNNIFLSKAGKDWLKRLRSGQFTEKAQQKIKDEKLSNSTNIDPWKIKNFEPIWGLNAKKDIEIFKDTHSEGEPSIAESNSVSIWKGPIYANRKILSLEPTTKSKQRPLPITLSVPKEIITENVDTNKIEQLSLAEERPRDKNATNCVFQYEKETRNDLMGVVRADRCLLTHQNSQVEDVTILEAQSNTLSTIKQNNEEFMVNDFKLEFTDKNTPVYCVCRKPYIRGQGMIGCDFCDEWYHKICLKLSKEDWDQIVIGKWSCPNCKHVSAKNTPFSYEEEKMMQSLPLI